MRRFSHILSGQGVAAAILLLCSGALPARSLRVAGTNVQAVQAASPQLPALTPEQQRAQRLRDEAAQLNDLAEQLQHEMRKAGDDKLSLQAVRLAQQIQGLSRQIQAELRQP